MRLFDEMNGKKMAKMVICFTVFMTIISCGSNSTSITDHENSQNTEEEREPGASFTHNYKIGDSYELDLTVFPSNSSKSKAPAIVFFYGGGWENGSINQFKQHARYFSQRGVTGILVDYRVSSRHNTTPFESVEDAEDALKFIFKNAATLDIDNNKVIVAGGSAGGHLALMSSFLLMNESAEKYNPAALVVFNPVVDTGPEGYGYNIIGDDYKKISPIDNIPGDPPPMIYFQGTSDNIINVGQAEEFCQAVERKEGICNLKLFQGLGHGFFNYNNTENFIQTVKDTDEFLNELQLLEGNSNIETWIEENN